MAPINMGDLCNLQPPDDEEQFFDRIVQIVDKYYPDGWRTWEVENYMMEELFGDKICPRIEAKLRFAIPTEDLARAYCPEEPSLSEKRFRTIKRILLQWPLGRALLYSPHRTVEKIHPRSYEVFMAAVKVLKPYLTSRSSTPCSKRRATSPVSTPSPKTPRREQSGEENLQTKFFESMMNALSHQTKAIENIASQVANLTATKPDPKEYGESGTEDTSGSAVECTSTDEEFEAPPFLQSPLASPFVNDTSVSKETSLENKIAEMESKLAALRNRKKDQSEPHCDFTPCTTEAEPKLARANPQLAEQGKKCQRLGEEGWKNIRYSEVQKTFHATPVFGALKVNSLLAASTPRSTAVAQLEKTDLTLGAITYGLFLQRKAFEDAWKKLEPSTQQEVQKNFLSPECDFKKISDSLVQYTCGRRAEVIQSRRETYKPPNKVLNDILHDIPPSDTHLFSEEKLSETIKNQGGAHKFFPKKTYDATKHGKKNSAPKGPNKHTRDRDSYQGKSSNRKQSFRNFRNTRNEKQDRGGNKSSKPTAGGKN